VRPLLVPILAAVAALALSACGEEGISVPNDDPTHEGAVLFSQRCSGCHTISAAGTQGSGGRALRNQGPDFNQRKESYADAIFAIRNGGFSGAIMPQNIVVGDQAKQVARFLEKWSGSDVEELPTPSSGGGGSGQASP
jgi:mono/diheme cytochrome c family protein